MLLFLANRFCSPVIGVGIDVNEVQILKKKLFENYDREIIPTTNTDQPILVLLSFFLLSDFELDMKQKALSTSVVFQISWKDELLTWNKTHHNGFDNLIVSLKSVWKPDVIILNSLHEKKVLTNDGDDTNYVTINSDGMIKWCVYVNLKTHCKVRMKFYPFETQECFIDITKSYIDDQSVTLKIANNSMDLERNDLNSEWEIFPIEASQRTFRHLERELTGLQLKIKMKRFKKFYTWNFLMPSMSLSIANCFTFVLPVKSNQKLSLCIFIFLANAVLIRLFNDSIPPVFETSLFGMLLWINLLLSGIGILLNIIITALYYRKSPKGVSPFCGNVTNWFKCKSKQQQSSEKNKKRYTKSVETQTDDIRNRDELLDNRETTPHPDETTVKKPYDTQTNDTNDENSANYLAKTSDIDVCNVNTELTSISDTFDEKHVQSSSKEQTSSVEKEDKSSETTRTNSLTETTPRTDSAYENVDTKLGPKSNTQRKNVPVVSEELPLTITNRDIKISMKDSDDTFIDHGAMKIKLCRESNHGFPDEGTTWSDVARNIDITSTCLLIITYGCVNGFFLYALLNETDIIYTF